NLLKVYTPRRACMAYETPVIRLHLGSDLLIAASYYSIPLALLFFIRRRKDLLFGWVFWLFGAFILACGTTHLFAVIDLWQPFYRLDGLVKLVTAALSVLTAVALWPLLPRALALPSRNKLEAEVAERTAALRRTNDELRDSERRLRLFVDHAPAALAMLDRDLRYLAVSRRWLADFQLGERDLHGLSHYEVFSAVPEAWKAACRRGLAGEVVRSDEDRFERADASVQWLKWEVRPWQTASGEIGGIVISSEDITERKRAEASAESTERALADSEQRFRLVANSIPQLAWMARADGWIFWYNQRWYDYTGTTSDEMEGWGWQSVHDPKELPRILERWRAAVASGEAWEDTFPLRRSDGEMRWHLSRALPLKDEGGRVVYWFGTNTDVTGQRQAAERLRQSEQLYRSLMEANPIGVLYGDVHGGIQYANDALLKMLGYEPPDVTAGRLRWTDLTPAQWLAADERAIAEARTRGYCTPYEKEYLRQDGTLVPTLVGFALLGDERQDSAAFVLDLTSRKNAERERERLLEAEREARAEAETASRLKDEFLTTLSHELRTPLSAISGWSQLLLRHHKDDGEVGKGLAVIERNARAQVKLVEDLLDMSRIVSGKFRIEVQRVDLAEVITNAVESLRPAAEAKQIRVQTVLDPLAGPVRGDPTRLQQVIWNLLSNAVKFTPRGGKVQMALERVNSHVEITVADTGVGIAADFLPNMFERFRQADAGSTRKAGGLGIGLAIVKNIVELHGGTVRAKSPGEGQGATFSV
ncbi:MAG: PAS domain S-box protein, partial [Acidobacteriota bacterium]|nr:PAS domain S-box protein [Acidobacteriota bacterium]